MAKSKNDPYKRKSAQALNHLAAAILDIYEIYEPFDRQLQMLREQEAAEPSEQTRANAERYAGYVHELYTIMTGISATREHIILFIGEVWNLDEESVKVYMG